MTPDVALLYLVLKQDLPAAVHHTYGAAGGSFEGLVVRAVLLYVCMCMCVYMYVSLHTRTHTHTQTHTYTHSHTRASAFCAMRPTLDTWPMVEGSKAPCFRQSRMISLYIYMCVCVCIYMYVNTRYVLIRPPIPYITSSRIRSYTYTCEFVCVYVSMC
jgi:hypothetical protein